jgi:hypothetical protein
MPNTVLYSEPTKMGEINKILVFLKFVLIGCYKEFETTTTLEGTVFKTTLTYDTNCKFGDVTKSFFCLMIY